MKLRLNIYLDPDLSDRLGRFAAQHRSAKSAIIQEAVASYLSPDHSDRREAVLTRRLDILTRQHERVARDLTIAVETMALFVRFWLAVTPPLPESQQAAARAKGAERYRGFVETLGRRLQRGDTLVHEVSREIWPAFVDGAPATAGEGEEAGDDPA